VLGPVILAAALASLLGCRSPLLDAEARYRQGDQLGALETWRSIPADSSSYDQARRRLSEVEAEFDQLVLRYKQRGRYFERSGRLAESILNYRLALKLQPDDRDTLDRVQQLARELVRRKADLHKALREALQERRLAEAGVNLAALRELDPFDPALESEERQLDESLRVEVERAVAEGRRRFQAADLNRAAAAFQAALELDPENETARGYLSYVAALRAELQRAGRLPSGVLTPDVFASESEIRAEGLYQNAIASERSGDPWAAIRYDLAALRADARHAGARSHLAGLRSKLAPNVEELIEAGRVAFRQEDLESALDQWRRALLVEPENERAREYVARAERMLENLERLRAEPTGR
jgi:tetratricopeptide (TPR) repeat protein